MRWQPKIQVVELTTAERHQVEEACSAAAGSGARIDLHAALSPAATGAHSLPLRIRRALYDFRLHQGYHAVCVRTSEPLPEIIGPTPAHHRAPGEVETVTRYDLMHLMFASLVGEPFAWSSIQNGYVFNDIIPVREHAERPASSGFVSDFGLHTEDAFHPWAGDYLGLMCLRNPDRIATTLAGFDVEELSPFTRDILFEPRFIVGANVAHEVERVTAPSPILFGDPAEPYMRINLNATSATPGDGAAASALQEFVQVLERNTTGVVFEPGDFWYIDNLRVAHGRERYQPRFDGRDRWLRRLYISSAYRYTRGLREHAGSRVLDPARRQWRAYV